jgi:hypothetical protein
LIRHVVGRARSDFAEIAVGIKDNSKPVAETLNLRAWASETRRNVTIAPM